MDQQVTTLPIGQYEFVKSIFLRKSIFLSNQFIQTHFE